MKPEAWDPENKKPRRGVVEPTQGFAYSNVSSRISSPSYQRELASGKPECVLKVASFARGASVKKLLGYISRVGQEAEMEVIDNFGLHHQGKDAVQKIYDSWKGDFERKCKGSNRIPRHGTHIILSAITDGSKAEERKVAFAAQDFVDRTFNQEGYEYVYALHNDTEHPHVHIVVKNYNKLTKKKLSLTKAKTFEIRQAWAETLTQNGLEANATLRRDRPQVLENIMQQKDRMKKNKPWHEAQMEIAAMDSDVNLSQRRVMLKKVRSLKDEVNLHKNIPAPEKKALGSKLKRLRQAILHADKKGIRKEVRWLKLEMQERVVIGNYFEKALDKEPTQTRRRVFKHKPVIKHYISVLRHEINALLESPAARMNGVREGLTRQLNAASRLLDRMNKPSRMQGLAMRNKSMNRTNQRER